jgi:cysteine desulfuration protein SufE
MNAEDVTSEFLRLENWDDRHRYLIQSGIKLGPMPREAYTEENRVGRGFTSFRTT